MANCLRYSLDLKVELALANAMALMYQTETCRGLYGPLRGRRNTLVTLGGPRSLTGFASLCTPFARKDRNTPACPTGPAGWLFFIRSADAYWTAFCWNYSANNTLLIPGCLLCSTSRFVTSCPNWLIRSCRQIGPILQFDT